MQVVALTTALGSLQGTESGTFAIGLVFSLVVSNLSLANQDVAMKSTCMSAFETVAHSPTSACVCRQVMYDASGVRLHAGKQASVLNILISELPPDHPGSETRPLRDRLGHTPIQVGR